MQEIMQGEGEESDWRGWRVGWSRDDSVAVNSGRDGLSSCT